MPLNEPKLSHAGRVMSTAKTQTDPSNFPANNGRAELPLCPNIKAAMQHPMPQNQLTK
jgi:hypothetical protein